MAVFAQGREWLQKKKMELLTFLHHVTIVIYSWGQMAAEAPHKHSVRIEAHNCTKCVNVFSNPIDYIGFQLHRMLEEITPKVTTHSPYAQTAQQNLLVITYYMNSSLYYQKIYFNLDTAGYYYLEVLC